MLLFAHASVGADSHERNEADMSIVVNRSIAIRALRILSMITATVMLVALAACGDNGEGAAAEDVAAGPSPKEEPADFTPERIFQVELSDEQPIGSVAYHPDGDMVAAGMFTEVSLMDPSDGTVIERFEFDHSIETLEFSPDGTILGAAQGVYGVRLVFVDDGSEAIAPHGGYDNRLAFAPDGETIATANRDGILWAWDVETGEQVSEFVPPAEEYALSVAYSPDGDMVALGNWVGDTFLFNTKDGALVNTFENPEDYGFAYDLAFSPDGEHLAVAGTRSESNEVARVWEVEDGSEHGVITLSSETRAVAYAPGGGRLAVGDSEGVTVARSDDMAVLTEIKLDAAPDATVWVTDIKYSPDGRFILFSRWDGYVELWQVQE